MRKKIAQADRRRNATVYGTIAFPWFNGGVRNFDSEYGGKVDTGQQVIAHSERSKRPERRTEARTRTRGYWKRERIFQFQ